MDRELDDVERPFVAQLRALGWTHIEGSLDNPALTGRGSFAEVIQEGTLREQLRALNPDPEGKPWLDEARLSEAVAAITRLGAHKPMEANEKATELLTKGLTVDGLPGWDGGRGQTIRYIDWDTPANNRFTVVSQYRVDCPPGFDTAKGFIVPDLVLLVNGMPLVVVECKSPSILEPMADAVDQLRRYSNQRKAAFEVDDNEGNEALFTTNQLLIATCMDDARVGCIGAAFEHYAQWKTVEGPNGTGSEAEVARALSKSAAEPSRSGWWPGCWRPRTCSTWCGTSCCSCRWAARPSSRCAATSSTAPSTARSPASRPGRRACSTASTTSAAASSGTRRARARPDDGVPGAQDARARAASALQGHRRHRPQGPADASSAPPRR